MSPAANATTPDQEKLSVERISEGDIVCVRFAGVMDESFEGKRLGTSLRAKVVVLDLGKVSKISSFGIREWSEFIGALARAIEHIYLIECTAKVMDQINMVAGFIGKARVISFYGPYRCDFCDLDRRVLFQVDRDNAAIRSFEPPEQLCETCARPQFFDEDPASFFATVARQPQFDLASGVSEFLSAKLNYNVTGGNRRLQIDKYVEGEYTFVRLWGNLDGAFPSEKVAEGLEGAVVVDVSGLGGVDIAGAAEWRNFITLARGGATRIYLLDCPPILLDRLPRAEDLADEVLSISMPYNCASCSTTTSEIIEVEEHYDILRFATPPEMRCANCKQATACAAQESLLSRLRSLAKPTADNKLKAFIKTARKHKPESQGAQDVAPTGAVGKKTVAFVGFALAGVLVASGVTMYFVATQRKAVSTPVAIEQRPAWVIQDTPFAGYCTNQINTLTCVGVSAYQPNLEDAKAQARDVALEEAVQALSINFESEEFDTRIRSRYSGARDALYAAFENDRSDRRSAEYTKSLAALAEARHRAAEAFMASSNDAVPKAHSGLYWEKFDDKFGVEFLAYTKIDITTDAQRLLVKIYTTEREVGGGKAMTAYPLFAFSHKNFNGGALVTEATGALEAAGDYGLITSVGGTPIFSVTDLMTAVERGGALGLATPVEPAVAPTPSSDKSKTPADDTKPDASADPTDGDEEPASE